MLDYEIETVGRPLYRSWIGYAVEKKRCSITRLKLWRSLCGIQLWDRLKRKDARLRDWNPTEYQPPKHWTKYRWKEKMLDYEIETWPYVSSIFISMVVLKRKDARLRDWNFEPGTGDYQALPELKRKDARLRDWNVSLNWTLAVRANLSWKEKMLDYEIETTEIPIHCVVG